MIRNRHGSSVARRGAAVAAVIGSLLGACGTKEDHGDQGNRTPPVQTKCPDFTAACQEWMSATSTLGCADQWAGYGKGCDCSYEIPDLFYVGDGMEYSCEPQATAMAKCAALHPACHASDGRMLTSWQNALELSPEDTCMAERHSLDVCYTTPNVARNFLPWGSGINFLRAGDSCRPCLDQCKTEAVACLNDLDCWKIQACGGGVGADCSDQYPKGKATWDAWAKCAVDECAVACKPDSGGSGGTSGGGGDANASGAPGSSGSNNASGSPGSGGSSSACTGCSSNSDCGRCERCVLTTCTCVARLSCP